MLFVSAAKVAHAYYSRLKLLLSLLFVVVLLLLFISNICISIIPITSMEFEHTVIKTFVVAVRLNIPTACLTCRVKSGFIHFF